LLLLLKKATRTVRQRRISGFRSNSSTIWETGSLAPKRQGNGGWSKLGPYEDWVRARLVGKSDLTQEALARELHEEHGLRVAVSTIGYWLHRLGLTHKKRPARS
jgi:transposase